MPFKDISGKGIIDSPEQIGFTALKVGTVPAAFTVTIKVFVVAHWPGLGVKV